MNRRWNSTEQTRNELLEAFFLLYSERKQRITVKGITERAGYNRSTFYEYFQDLDDILFQLEEELLKIVSNVVNKNLEQTTFQGVLDNIMLLFEENGRYLRVLLGEKGDPAFAAKIKRLILPDLCRRLHIHTDDECPMVVLDMGISAILATVTSWYETGQIYPIERVAKMLLSLLQNVVLPELPQAEAIRKQIALFQVN